MFKASFEPRRLEEILRHEFRSLACATSDWVLNSSCRCGAVYSDIDGFLLRKRVFPLIKHHRFNDTIQTSKLRGLAKLLGRLASVIEEVVIWIHSQSLKLLCWVQGVVRLVTVRKVRDRITILFDSKPTARCWLLMDSISALLSTVVTIGPLARHLWQPSGFTTFNHCHVLFRGTFLG